MTSKICFYHSVANAVTSNANLTAGPIVMSAQKLQLKTVKAPTQQPQQQQQHRILNQSTVSAASQTLPSPNQVQHQLQQIQIGGRSGATSTGVISQRAFTALAAAKQQQQAAVNRRRSTTDATK